jgi:dTDP-glucose pyrophosphorylase
VKLARAFVGPDPFLLTFGDIICGSRNYAGICAAMAEHGAAAVLGVKSVDDPWQGAAVYADERGVVSRIVEKPPRGTSTTPWNSAGLYAFSPVIFDEIDTVKKSARGEYEITSAIQQLIDRAQPVRLYELHGAWRDVGRPEDLAQADRDLSDSRVSRT